VCDDVGGLLVLKCTVEHRITESSLNYTSKALLFNNGTKLNTLAFIATILSRGGHKLVPRRSDNREKIENLNLLHSDEKDWV
jgi:hypothetical protein